jgi:hypothetical protein
VIWQPIETAPREGLILVWDGYACDVAETLWESDGAPVWFNGDVTVNATHWMPLPAGPDVS